MAGAVTTGAASGAPGQTAPGKPFELPAAVKAITSIVRVAADVASGFEHPTAKKLIKEWEDMVEQAETLSKTGGDHCRCGDQGHRVRLAGPGVPPRVRRGPVRYAR